MAHDIESKLLKFRNTQSKGQSYAFPHGKRELAIAVAVVENETSNERDSFDR